MKRRWIYLIPIALLALGVVLGSFLDRSVSQALYDRNNGFGLFMAAFGEAPMYACIALVGFGFLWLSRMYDKIIVKVVLIAAFVAIVAAAIYFQGEHVFDVNAYYNPSLKWLGFLIGAVVAGLGCLGGYFLFRSSPLSRRSLLLILVFLSVCVGVSIGGNQLLKIFFSRPRFRFLSDMNVIEDCYRNWWQNGKSIRDSFLNPTQYFPNGLAITKEEFKSFPSGHMANTINLVIVLPLLPTINPRLKIKGEAFFVIALIWNLVLAYTRIRVGAHFLSDVSMGGLMTIVIGFIFIELNALHQKKTQGKEASTAA